MQRAACRVQSAERRLLLQTKFFKELLHLDVVSSVSTAATTGLLGSRTPENNMVPHSLPLPQSHLPIAASGPYGALVEFSAGVGNLGRLISRTQVSWVSNSAQFFFFHGGKK